MILSDLIQLVSLFHNSIANSRQADLSLPSLGVVSASVRVGLSGSYLSQDATGP